MAYAREHNYIVFTHDLDFSTILATSKDSQPSVIQLRANDISPEAAGNSILAAIRQMQTQLEAGALLYHRSQKSQNQVTAIVIVFFPMG